MSSLDCVHACHRIPQERTSSAGSASARATCVAMRAPAVPLGEPFLLGLGPGRLESPERFDGTSGTSSGTPTPTALSITDRGGSNGPSRTSSPAPRALHGEPLPHARAIRALSRRAGSGESARTFAAASRSSSPAAGCARPGEGGAPLPFRALVRTHLPISRSWGMTYARSGFARRVARCLPCSPRSQAAS